MTRAETQPWVGESGTPVELPKPQAARTPRILWVELTSKCPFDCVFCSRKLRRGAGQHLPFDIYTALLDALVDPRKLLLNYSGESTVYPDLIAAIQRARATGASAELVSVMASVPESLLVPLSESGLNRLTVSVHATDPGKFLEVYRHSSFDALRARLERFMELCRATPQPPQVDLAFVAMDSNLEQLSPVAAFAGKLGLGDIMIFPVIRRDEIDVQFPVELTAAGTHRPSFERRVQSAVEEAARKHPQIRFTIGNESFTTGERALGEVPVPCPRELPPGALIHSCEQNPWETAHVLANGDVVACEVLDRFPLGNLFEQPIGEIWQGAPYQRFRERYRGGEVAECRTCPWKRAYRAGPITSEIIAARGMSAQLLYGWHEPSAEEHIWSSQQAAAILEPRASSRTLHVSGMLPAGPAKQANQLTILVNGVKAGQVTNPYEVIMPFGLDFAVAPGHALWTIEFRTTHVYRPSERGEGTDQRDLGFALVLAVSKVFVEPAFRKRQELALRPLVNSVAAADRWGFRVKYRWHRSCKSGSGEPWRPGFSVVIPEWDNARELADCLASVRAAGREWEEPLEVVVVVNGSPASDYGALRSEHPDIRWRFYGRPLGFVGAVKAGLRLARYDWVYLLNSDVVLDPGALRLLAPRRSDRTFSIGSQIVLKDETRFRDETNWTTLLVESGLATIHDWIPKSSEPVPSFYSGGGASLFRARLLRSLMDASAYDPFYWEDVEWGWRARKLGYESWFCPSSVAHHTRRATIGRHFAADEIDRTILRNRLTFQLRNFTTAGSVERVVEEIAGAPQPVAEYFLAAQTRWRIACGRFWNHLAPFSDEEVFARWTESAS